MKRGVICHLSLCLALVVWIGSMFSGIPGSAVQAFAPRISGQWEMTANRDYQFLLDIEQHGNRITGTMTRTNGNEPVDRINGIIHDNGVIEFTRHRPGEWQQHYRGRIIHQHGAMSLEGTFNHNGSGNYSWNAEQRRHASHSGFNAADTPSHVEGRWNMIANHDFFFTLSIKQQGDRITGTMTRTNGNEPVDRISGVCRPDGTIRFTRHRPGEWEQHYQGRIVKQRHEGWIMEGTFDHNGAGNYPWSARLP